MAFFKLLRAFQKSRIALLQDDADDRCRALLCSPAQSCSTELMNTLIRNSGSHVSVAVSEERAFAFGLSRMNSRRSSILRSMGNSNTAVSVAAGPLACISVEAREGVSTGISAADRAKTVALLGGDILSPRLLVHPGHIFPVIANTGGVLVDSSLPNVAFDVVTLAGYSDAAVYVDLLNEQGEYMLGAEQDALAAELNIPIFRLSDCIHHRLRTENLVHQVAEAQLPSRFGGLLQTRMYRSDVFEGEHVALIKGPIDPEKPVLVRVQRESPLSDIFGGEPNTRKALQASLEAINRSEQGVLIYLRSSSSGSLQSALRSSSATDAPQLNMSQTRQYGIGAQILRSIGVRIIHLLVGSPHRYSGLENFDLHIEQQILLPLDSSSQLPRGAFGTP